MSCIEKLKRNDTPERFVVDKKGMIRTTMNGN
jgi:hypothetical protein